MLFTMIFFFRKNPSHNFSFLFQNCREKKIKQNSQVRKAREMLGVCRQSKHSEAVYRTHVFKTCCITLQISDVIDNMIRLLCLFVCLLVCIFPAMTERSFLYSFESDVNAGRYLPFGCRINKILSLVCMLVSSKR